MQLVDLLRKKMNDGELPSQDEQLFIGSAQLETMLEELKQCDEFKDCNLLIAKFPVMPDPHKEGQTIHMQTLRLHQDVRFAGISYLYSINLTPKMFDMDELIEPVKDGCLITPTVMDVKTFKLNKKVVLSFNEFDDDNIKVNSDLVKAELKRKIDQIFEDPESYTPPGHRSIMLRGMFKHHHYETPNNVIGKVPARISPVPVKF
jgi:hypothetical protein